MILQLLETGKNYLRKRNMKAYILLFTILLLVKYGNTVRLVVDKEHIHQETDNQLKEIEVDSIDSLRDSEVEEQITILKANGVMDKA